MQIFFAALLLFFMSMLRPLAADCPPLVHVFSDKEELGKAAAQKIAEVILQKQKAGKTPIVLGLATGNSPIPVYAAFKKLVQEYDLDLSDVVTFNLDEYLGLPASHPQSYHSFMFAQLFDDLLYSSKNPHGIRKENIHIPNGALELSPEEIFFLNEQFPERDLGLSLTQEEQFWVAKRRADEYEALLQRLGPIDLQILGIGSNGHIAFAEPGTSFASQTMIMKLTESTRNSNAVFFEDRVQDVPTFAISMGIQTILQAREILLIATGKHKADIIAKTLKNPVSPDIPGTALRLHEKTSFFLDEEAALGLNRNLTTRFYHARLLLDHQIQEGELWVCGGKIISPQQHTTTADKEIDAQGCLIAPGYIDLQINGGFGCDFSRDPEKIASVAKHLPQYGVTAFLPTVISSSPEQYKAVLPFLQPRSSWGNVGASILGIHLEGPYFSPQYCGAHNREFLRSSFDETSSIEDVYGSLAGVKMVTLAPEIPGALNLIQQLTEKNIVVSAGHSSATSSQIQAGIKAGIRFVTHLFNAMPSYHHRNPSIIGAALIAPALCYSVIVDGVHLYPETVSLCWCCNSDGMILVTDAMEALGLPNGKYQLGTMEVEVNNGEAYLAGTRTIAGSSLSLDQAVRHLRAITNCSTVQALEAASLKPAQLIGVYPSKGSLEVGADADFLLLDDDLYIQASYIGGELAWSR